MVDISCNFDVSSGPQLQMIQNSKYILAYVCDYKRNTEGQKVIDRHWMAKRSFRNSTSLEEYRGILTLKKHVSEVGRGASERPSTTQTSMR